MTRKDALTARFQKLFPDAAVTVYETPMTQEQKQALVQKEISELSALYKAAHDADEIAASYALDQHLTELKQQWQNIINGNDDNDDEDDNDDLPVRRPKFAWDSVEAIGDNERFRAAKAWRFCHPVKMVEFVIIPINHAFHLNEHLGLFTIRPSSGERALELFGLRVNEFKCAPVTADELHDPDVWPEACKWYGCGHTKDLDQMSHYCPTHDEKVTRQLEHDGILVCGKCGHTYQQRERGDLDYGDTDLFRHVGCPREGR